MHSHKHAVKQKVHIESVPMTVSFCAHRNMIVYFCISKLPTSKNVPMQRQFRSGIQAMKNW